MDTDLAVISIIRLYDPVISLHNGILNFIEF